MTDQKSMLSNPYPCDWGADIQERHWPVTLPPKEQPAPGSFSVPSQSFSPIAGSLAVWRPGKRRRILDRFSTRLLDSSLPGADIAVEYLRDKYTRNLAVSTIGQSGSVIFSFLIFLNECGTVIFQVTRQDIGGFVTHKQEQGLKINSVRAILRILYAFINFLVEKELLPYDILCKKIRIQEPEVLPRAIPAEDLETLLNSISTVRDRALILLLLRTGMRIGELLQVKVTDIVLEERKILLFLGEKNFQGRVVYYNEDAEHALLQWLRIRDEKKEYLFYSPTRETLSYVAAWAVMRKILERAGLSGKGYSLHSLRHTFATDMLNGGLRLEVLQQLLGHKSIEITMRYAKMSDTTREHEYLKAMSFIEQGEQHEPHRVSSELQKVFEEKKLLSPHRKKLSS